MSNMGLNMNITELKKHTDNIEVRLKETREVFEGEGRSSLKEAALIFIPMIEDQLAISKNILKILEKKEELVRKMAREEYFNIIQENNRRAFDQEIYTPDEIRKKENDG